MLTKEEIEKKYPEKKLEKIKYLDFWGKDLENIDIISELKSLKIISLSGNKISSLKPFQDLENLIELYLRNNNISNIDEIDYLKKCPRLKSLWLQDNPISKNTDEYRKNVIEKLPNLESLDNTPIKEIKNELNKKNIDNNKKKEHNETDLVIQGTDGNDEISNINENENINNSDNNKTKKKIKTDIDDLNDLILDNEPKNHNNQEELKKTRDDLLSTNKENKLEDLLLSYEKDESTKDKTNIVNETDNTNNNLLDSKSDIFKTGFSYINKNETQNLNKEINNNENKNLNQENKEENNPLDISAIKNLSIKEPNNDLLNDILRNVDTSQTFIRKANSNKITNTNLNMDNNINDNNNFTKNLNDMIKNVNPNPNTSQTFKLEGNTKINNILKDVKTSQTMGRKNDNEIKKILGEVNSSQTMNNIKDQEINNILKDVETTATNFNKVNDNDLINDNLKKNEKNNNNLQSIDDIRKIFNNDYQSNNLYGNNIKDTRINNIFKSELISSESSSFFNKSNRGKPQNKPIIPKFSQNFHYNYDNDNASNADNVSNYNDKNNVNNKYNINPNHMHKINAIINLLEDLNLENLLHVKNQIVKLIESKN